jgi:hypothetical protein
MPLSCLALAERGCWRLFVSGFEAGVLGTRLPGSALGHHGRLWSTLLRSSHGGELAGLFLFDDNLTRAGNIN